jgi:hypothetical protein
MKNILIPVEEQQFMIELDSRITSDHPNNILLLSDLLKLDAILEQQMKRCLDKNSLLVSCARANSAACMTRSNEEKHSTESW